MTIFALHCLDKANSLDLRMANREAHLAYVGGFRDQLKLAGPLLDAEGNMAGSLIIVDMADIEAAREFSANDPYRKAGLFERVEITAFKPTLGGFA